ncbi:MAG: SDR family oxidoreductase [Bacteriovoracaceae bacterium]|nr:SDR family oxidoreductase [Bacteriovoracaceae bacterium]
MKNFSLNDVIESISVLEHVVNNSELLTELTHDQRVALFKAAGTISRPTKEEIKKRDKDVKIFRQKQQIEQNRLKRAMTGIRSARENAVFIAPDQLLIESDKAYESAPELDSARNCYVCKAEFTKLHFFYDTMCKDCGDFNYHKRFQRTDMTGQIAVITGSRLKIGYQAVIMMLQSGATVIATTRFPVDSAMRFSKEKDYHEWKDRLHIYGLDLRHTPSVEIFARYLEETFPRLDILINNAAQTVRRPPGFYAHMMELEKSNVFELPFEAQTLLQKHTEFKQELNRLSYGGDFSNEKALPVAWHGEGPGVGIRASAELSQIPYSYDNSIVAQEVFPEGQLDADLQQVDLRKTNSWRMRLGDVPTPELLEVQLVNAVAPFVLCNRLVHMMRRDFTGKKHIVNVTAMEGKFYRFKKEDRHPHTNMAKAALNMMTHTSASDFAKDGIFMNAVDTGWVTDEDPAEISTYKQKVHDFQPPLDIVDGAARICDPFIDGINSGKHWCGQFLKDYKPIDW